MAKVSLPNNSLRLLDMIMLIGLDRVVTSRDAVKVGYLLGFSEAYTRKLLYQMTHDWGILASGENNYSYTIKLPIACFTKPRPKYNPATSREILYLRSPLGYLNDSQGLKVGNSLSQMWNDCLTSFASEDSGVPHMVISSDTSLLKLYKPQEVVVIDPNHDLGELRSMGWHRFLDLDQRFVTDEYGGFTHPFSEVMREVAGSSTLGFRWRPRDIPATNSIRETLNWLLSVKEDTVWDLARPEFVTFQEKLSEFLKANPHIIWPLVKAKRNVRVGFFLETDFFVSLAEQLRRNRPIFYYAPRGMRESAPIVSALIAALVQQFTWADHTKEEGYLDYNEKFSRGYQMPLALIYDTVEDIVPLGYSAYPSGSLHSGGHLTPISVARTPVVRRRASSAGDDKSTGSTKPE